VVACCGGVRQAIVAPSPSARPQPRRSSRSPHPSLRHFDRAFRGVPAVHQGASSSTHERPFGRALAGLSWLHSRGQLCLEHILSSRTATDSTTTLFGLSRTASSLIALFSSPASILMIVCSEKGQFELDNSYNEVG